MSKRTFEEVSNAEEASKAHMTLANLPDNTIHLGGSEFLVVRSFMGQTRIHVRKFVENEDRQLIPTKDGVSLSPKVWVALTAVLPKMLSKRFYDRYPNDYVEVIEKDLCIVKDTITTGPVEQIEIRLQRLFQRRDKSLQFVPETVQLVQQQCGLLLSSSQRVKELVEVSLLKVTLRHHVERTVMRQATPEARAYNARPYNTGLGETMASLRKCFLHCLSLKMKELAPCYGCDGLPCSCHSAEELLNNFFYPALYELNYIDVAQSFVEENMHHLYFANLIMTRDFFMYVDAQSFLNELKNMYAPTEEMLQDLLEIC